MGWGGGGGASTKRDIHGKNIGLMCSSKVVLSIYTSCNSRERDVSWGGGKINLWWTSGGPPACMLKKALFCTAKETMPIHML